MDKKGWEQAGVSWSHETTFPLQTCYKDPAVSGWWCSSALGKYPAE